MNDTRRRTVESGYDHMAEQSLATKDPEDPPVLPAPEEMVRSLPVGDLGCGSGIPATRWLSERGFAVTGVDFAERQLGLAREPVPGAAFLKADMTDLAFEPGPASPSSSASASRRGPGSRTSPSSTASRETCSCSASE